MTSSLFTAVFMMSSVNNHGVKKKVADGKNNEGIDI